MVEVFKTNINTKRKAKQVMLLLKELFPVAQINFDLEDCDNILRIETVTNSLDDKALIQIINEQGFYIETLNDNASLQNL